MSKKGCSRPGLFGGMNHYDANGKLVVVHLSIDCPE